MSKKHRLNQITWAIGLGLVAHSTSLIAAQADEQLTNEQEIEEVVAVGTRLQGSAAAVVEERKNQAFVADILGSEQLSRTGDSDAASALRRVTGLTLVDGKFIYVRGLGERYSSARLNGAYIPSPDLTRNVIPLDIFPASIIESMAVQKAYSPDMPAAFGGGNIDIRTKTAPSEFTAGIEVGAGYDTASSDGFTYNRNENGIPSELSQAISTYRGDFSIGNIVSSEGFEDGDLTRAEQATAVNNALLKSLPRDYELKEESLDPRYNIKAHYGDSFEESYFGGKVGFLLAGAYKNEWDFEERFSSVITQDLENEEGNVDCTTSLATSEDVSNSCYNTVKNSQVTTETESYNGSLSLSYRLGTHSISAQQLYIIDNEDESEIAISQSPAGSSTFSIAGDGIANRNHEFNYEERQLNITQVMGQHTFLDYFGIGADWQYTEAKATTDIPTSADFEFRDTYNSDGSYAGSTITGDDNRVIMSFTNMEERVKSYGGNLTLPLSFESMEVEFKVGYDFSDRARIFNTSSFAINNSGGSGISINDGSNDALNNSGFLTDDFIDNNAVLVDFNEPTAPDADDYIAAQKVDAGYASFDVFYDQWIRISGGIRYEEFKQSSIGTSSLIFDEDDLNTFYDPDKIQAGSVITDDWYPALSVTYVGGDDYQVRLGYGETVVRPDFREVVPVTYYDPLTDIRTFGRTGIKSSPIKNYDLRYEYYGQAGNSFSVAAFYKDITAPIETVLNIGDEDYSASFINGETAEVYGIEAEWLQDLTFVSEGLFTSGNITLSDSEASIDPALAGTLTNPKKRMTGHSEYVVNLQLNYDSLDGMHSSSLVYNVFGERILAAGVANRDDAYEQPFHSLDLVYTYYPDFNSKIKFKVKNLLDEDQEVTQSDIIVRSKEQGVTFDLSYSYEF